MSSLGGLRARTRARGALVLALAAVFVTGCAPERHSSGLVLRIRTQRDGKLLYRKDVEPGDVFEFTWIHSVEHFPWTERFDIRDDGTLFLREIRFRGYGAGVPNERGKSVRIENGDIVHEGIDEPYTSYRWINSATAVDSLTLNGTVMIRGSDLPHHEALELRIERGR